MGEQLVNMLGEVIWDEDESLARERQGREDRDGEPFTAVTDCPWCGKLAVHWLSPPRFEPSRDDPGPAAGQLQQCGRALRMINDAAATVTAITGGPPYRRWDKAGTVVARECINCDYRWGQA